MREYKCMYCHRVVKNAGGLATHEPYCKKNPQRKQRYRSPKAGSKKGSIPWNKGLSKYTDDRVAKSGMTISKRYNEGSVEKSKGIASSTEKEIIRRNKISRTMKKNPFAGGRRRGSGRGKQGWYKGYWCDSSWELAFVIYYLDNGIPLNRNSKKFYYEYNNEQHYWLPDFIVDSLYVEIKGYEDDKSRAKHQSFIHPLIILKKKEMEKYIRYSINKYGKNYTGLYEEEPADVVAAVDLKSTWH